MSIELSPRGRFYIDDAIALKTILTKYPWLRHDGTMASLIIPEGELQEHVRVVASKVCSATSFEDAQQALIDRD